MKSGKRIRAMFSAIAPRYDFLNHLLSLNLDSSWRSKAVSILSLKPGTRALDVCAGTGDMAVKLARRHPRAGAIILADFSLPMLQIAQRKCMGVRACGGMGGTHTPTRCRAVAADALKLPFGDRTFDLVTCAFGVRNFEDLAQGLGEVFRVTRPGGQIAILEFCGAKPTLLNAPFRLFLRHVLPQLGNVIAHHPFAYSYLADSARRFLSAAEMTGRLREVGFSEVALLGLTWNVAILFRAIKPASEKGLSDGTKAEERQDHH